MDTKKLFSNLRDKEHKLLQRMKEKEDVQLLVCDGQESFICIGGAIIDQANLFIGYISKDGKVCKGNYGNNHFSLTSESGCIRIIIDEQRENDIRYHVNCDGVYAKLSNNSEDDDDKLLIIFIESPKFIQFTLFDSQLVEKVSHIFATATQIRGKIRNIAYSLLNRNFPEFTKNMQLLEMDSYDHEIKEQN